MKKSQDEEHLDLLGIFHYVLGGLTALFACFPLIHLFIGWIFVGVAALLILFGWSIAICLLLAGSKLRNRRSYTFCLVVAGIECLNMPLGTILGVFTIVVLSRESVKAIFEEARVG